MDKKTYDAATFGMTPQQKAFYDILVSINWKLGKLLDMDADIAEVTDE